MLRKLRKKANSNILIKNGTCYDLKSRSKSCFFDCNQREFTEEEAMLPALIIFHRLKNRENVLPVSLELTLICPFCLFIISLVR